MTSDENIKELMGRFHALNSHLECLSKEVTLHIGEKLIDFVEFSKNSDLLNMQYSIECLKNDIIKMGREIANKEKQSDS